MPYKSLAQARFFHAKAKRSKKFARMAKEFAAHTDFGSLPERKGGLRAAISRSKRRKVRR